MFFVVCFYGLIVNSKVDEWKDFVKLVIVVLKMMKIFCILFVRIIVNMVGLEVDEDVIWFRLLIMYIYYVGVGNVKVVV